MCSHLLAKESEIDLWPLNKKLAQEGRLLLPRLIHHEIIPFYVKETEHLIKSEWGVFEPNPQKEEKASLKHCHLHSRSRSWI